jgi:uridine kinase
MAAIKIPNMVRSAGVMTVAPLARRLAGTEPRLGRTRLIAVDGRSGAGKTWLAGELAAPLGAPVIHMDDLCPGWDGLVAAGDALADWVVGPLGRGEAARWRRFDWEAMSYAEWHTTEAAEVVVVEGCGSVRSALAASYAARIWVEAPAAARQQRLRARADWAAYEPHARQWAIEEDRLYRAEHTRAHCDVIVESLPATSDGDIRLSVCLPDRGSSG